MLLICASLLLLTYNSDLEQNNFHQICGNLKSRCNPGRPRISRGRRHSYHRLCWGETLRRSLASLSKYGPGAGGGGKAFIFRTWKIRNFTLNGHALHVYGVSLELNAIRSTCESILRKCYLGRKRSFAYVYSCI